METTIRFDLLRELHAFVMGLPKNQFDLGHVIALSDDYPEIQSVDQSLVGTENFRECGAIACVMGWASVMPKFREMGLDFNFHTGSLLLNGQRVWYDDAASELFGITRSEGGDLFCTLGDSHYDEVCCSNDDVDQREVFDRRFLMFMREKDAQA